VAPPLDAGGGGGDGRPGRPDKAPSVNVLGGPLLPCSVAPVTGFFRDGCCNTGAEDLGRHVVCAVMTEAFLAFSRQAGNDLSTPMPAYGFPGLRPGDRWCLCAARWEEARRAGAAPRVLLEATHIAALEVCGLADLRAHAADAGEDPDTRR
jgi:uncharacterized protein (DUF2237 family)